MPATTIKVSLRLFTGDREKLLEFYPNLGYNAAIRQLVRRHIRALEARMAEKEPSLHQEQPYE